VNGIGAPGMSRHLPGPADLPPGLAKLVGWFIHEAMPVWATSGFDDLAGHFVESLELDGAPERQGLLRTRSAARQIYVFAHAHALGVAPSGTLQKSERAFANLHSQSWIEGNAPGYARSIDRFTGAVVDPVRDLYDQACVLLALAWLFKATGRQIYNQHIDDALSAIDGTLAAPHGGWAEDSENALPRRQNPHMHFFEACLALVEITGEQRYMARADELFRLFEIRFFDRHIGALREYFGPRWEVSDAFGSDRLDPGHMAEWVWLLRRYARLSSVDVDDICKQMIHWAEAFGLSDGGMFLVDEASPKGVPLKASRRLWPQAELIKAHVAQFAAHGDRRHLQKADNIAAALHASYLSETPIGTWRDCFDLDGRPIAKSIPSSSHYHLWTAVADLLDRGQF
jgi:mannose/cellobiose epimerase-like protein (N-acyl-D-glucosamine 2-epimerase family)